MSNNIKVLMVAPESLPVPPVKGGAVESVIHQAAGYLKDRFSISVLSPADNSLPLVHVDEKVEYRHVERMCSMKREKLPLRLAKIPVLKLPLFMYGSPYIHGMLNEIDNIKPDIIHIHNSPLYVLFIKQQYPHIKVILHMHNQHLVRMNRSLANDIVKSADIIAGVSNFIISEIVDAFSWAENKCRCLYNGVDIERFKPNWLYDSTCVKKKFSLPLEGKILLYAGRLTPQKGIHTLLAALGKGLPDDWNLVVAGASWFGEQKPNRYVNNLIQISQNLSRPVFFTGHIPHSLMPELIGAADYVVLPSIAPEAFPLVVLEAQAAGVPVLSNKIGGAAEAIDDGKTGLVNTECDLAGLQELLEQVFRCSDDELAVLGAQARKHVSEHFSWDICANQYAQVYLNLKDC